MERARLTSLYSHSESEECVKQLLELEEEIKDDDLRQQVTFYPSSFTSPFFYCASWLYAVCTQISTLLYDIVFFTEKDQEKAKKMSNKFCQLTSMKQTVTVSDSLVLCFGKK